jgi:SPASM domain peptide maturase of grasp-with-spasm system
MNQNSFFKLFSNCMICKGVNRSLILDIQRESYVIIPDTMQEVIELLNNKTAIEDVYSLYGYENRLTLDEYIEFLIDEDFGFLTDTDEFDLFINLNKNFDKPSSITNCIIEVSHDLSLFNNIINELHKFNCESLQLVSYSQINIEHLDIILKLTNETNLRSVELILKYSSELLDFINRVEKEYFRVTELTIHSSKGKNKKINELNLSVNFIDYDVTSFINCGIIDSKYFNINRDKVLESLNHNSCLHKKLSIDKDGNIKNCPSMAESFGNIKDTTLEEALNHPNFKKYWNITKDQIEVCKDCEFRHICTDCRAHIEDPHNQYSKPLKCGYNPYTNEWEEWSTNPLKQKGIEYYGMQELVKKDA